MVDVNVFKYEKLFKLKISHTSKKGYEFLKNKILESGFITYIPDTRTFTFEFYQLADVMQYMDDNGIEYVFVNRTKGDDQTVNKQDESIETPKKSYRKKEFVDGVFKVIYKTVEIREHKDGYFQINMEWNHEVNDFLKTLHDESRYFDSDLKVWNITKPYLRSFVEAVEKAGLKYEIHYCV
jgi:hypothetical protein